MMRRRENNHSNDINSSKGMRKPALNCMGKNNVTQSMMGLLFARYVGGVDWLRKVNIFSAARTNSYRLSTTAVGGRRLTYLCGTPFSLYTEDQTA